MSEIVDRITAAYESERLQRRHPVTVDDLPFCYEDINTQWLTTVICKSYPGAKVTSFRLDTPDEGTSSRRRIFIEYNDDGRQAGLPPSIFCKSTQKLQNRICMGPQGGIYSEVTFYNSIRPNLAIEVPVSYHANFNATTFNSIIMLADESDEVEFCTANTEITRQRIENQFELLAELHGKYYQSSDLHRSLPPYPTFAEYFSMLDFPEFENASLIGFEKSAEVIPEGVFKHRKDIWRLVRKSVEAQASLPMTFAHGDPHIRNWYVKNENLMGLCDWQGSCRGHWSRDLIYTLVTSLTIENRRAWENDLISYYMVKLEESSGLSISFEDVRKICFQQLMTVLVYWTMVFGPTYQQETEIQPRAESLEIIRRIAVAIDDHEVIQSFG